MFTPGNWNQPQTVTVTADRRAAGLAPVGSATASPARDVDYNSALVVSVDVTLDDPSTTLSLAAEPNPANEPVTVTATVDGNGTPRGTVQFTVDGVATGGEVAVVDEVARLDVGVLTHGRHTIAATYASSSGHDPSTDAIDVVVNDAPVAAADTVTVAEDAAATTVDVVGNDTDADGDTLTIDEHTQPGHGDVACDQTSCTYTPDGDFHGTDTFTYTVSDGFATATATVTITVDPVNDPPTVTVSIEVQAVAGQATVIDVLSNAGDVDGDTLTLVGHTDAEHGELDCTPAGTCTYTPDSGYSGSDQFNYTITDGPPPAAISAAGDQSATTHGTVTITVEAGTTTSTPPTTTTPPTTEPTTTTTTPDHHHTTDHRTNHHHHHTADHRPPTTEPTTTTTTPPTTESPTTTTTADHRVADHQRAADHVADHRVADHHTPPPSSTSPTTNTPPPSSTSATTGLPTTESPTTTTPPTTGSPTTEAPTTTSPSTTSGASGTMRSASAASGAPDPTTVTSTPDATAGSTSSTSTSPSTSTPPSTPGPTLDTTSTPDPGGNASQLPQTGTDIDEAAWLLALMLTLLGLAVLALAALMRRRHLGDTVPPSFTNNSE